MILPLTPSQTVGPFFHLGCTQAECAGVLAGPRASGEHIRLEFALFDADGESMDDAMIEIWHADHEGHYVSKAINIDWEPAAAAFRSFGRLPSSADGACEFHTVKPGGVRQEDGGLHAPHINVSVFARGILQRLVTRVYFADDPANASDPVLALVPPERRPTLLARKSRSGAWRFELRLGGKNETVFFDV